MTHPKIFSVFSAAFFFLVVIVNLVLEMNTYNENYFVNIRKPVLLFIYRICGTNCACHLLGLFFCRTTDLF